MTTTTTDAAPILQVKDMYKHFGGLVAVNHVNLEIYPGEVVGLLGDNGAGKSTLIKLISGVYHPDGGSLILDGKEITFASPLDARRQGIETIYQDLALCENLDAGANIFLGREARRNKLGIFRELDNKYMLNEARHVLDQLDIDIPDLRKPIRQLSGGQRQAVAIWTSQRQLLAFLNRSRSCNSFAPCASGGYQLFSSVIICRMSSPSLIASL